MKYFISLKYGMPALMLLSALCMTHPAFASTVINGDLSGDHVWTPANSPYVIQDARILPGASVTVEPGVVVKMSPKNASGPFIVQGTLTLGHADAAVQVIVTSLLDDVVGGDTNGDGDATTPNPGDWRNISASAGGVIRMYHTTMLYGGANTGYDYVCKGYCGYTKYADGQLVNDGGSVEVHTVSFSRSIGEHVSQFSGVSVLDGTKSGFVLKSIHGKKNHFFGRGVLSRVQSRSGEKGHFSYSERPD